MLSLSAAVGFARVFQKAGNLGPQLGERLVRLKPAPGTLQGSTSAELEDTTSASLCRWRCKCQIEPRPWCEAVLGGDWVVFLKEHELALYSSGVGRAISRPRVPVSGRLQDYGR